MSDFSAPTPITNGDDCDSFDCGSEALNRFLKHHALGKQNAKLSRTYVVARNNRVIAYYTLAHIAVTQDETPRKLGRGMPSSLPAMLLARLAVDTTAQGLGLGRSLLVDALRRTWAVMDNGAAPVRLFVVDAKDEVAKSFYERFEMTPSPHDPNRLFLSYKDLRALFDGEE
ncbi:MAG TPA: GNAT family N-acetyltransferase [Capsulimonadaceae bacterium]|jgi:GNAT superfamily N-acetyltransferase